MSATVALVAAALAVVGCSAVWVARDARARGLPTRKALTWAALQGIEWPLFLWLYRRARPTRLRGETGPT
jgi:hypothetical protein